jgi:hypothetical protein
MAHPKGSKRSETSRRRVRVRARRLDQIDEVKIAIALAIMSRRLLEQTDHPQGRGPVSPEEEA